MWISSLVNFTLSQNVNLGNPQAAISHSSLSIRYDFVKIHQYNENKFLQVDVGSTTLLMFFIGLIRRKSN